MVFTVSHDLAALAVAHPRVFYTQLFRAVPDTLLEIAAVAYMVVMIGCVVAFLNQKSAVIAIPDWEVLEGHLPPGKMKMVLAWVEMHRDDLMADWDLAVNGQQPFRVEPLR